VIGLLDEGARNHLLPQYVALNAVARRLVVTSNAGPTLAVVDLDDARLEAIWPLADEGAVHARGVALDEAGVAWVISSEEPSVQRVDAAGGVALDLGQQAAFVVVERPGCRCSLCVLASCRMSSSRPKQRSRRLGMHACMWPSMHPLSLSRASWALAWHRARSLASPFCCRSAFPRGVHRSKTTTSTVSSRLDRWCLRLQ
jgi:hypothetical protein